MAHLRICTWMSECSEDDQFCCAGCCAALRFLHWFCLLLKCRDLQRWVSHHRWINQGSLLCAKDLLTFETCLQAYSIEACCIENPVCIELVIRLFSLLFLGATARSISLMADRPVSCVSASKFLFQNLWTPLNSAFASTNEDMLSWSPSIPKLFEHVAVIAGPFVDMIPAILAPLIAKRLSRWADNVSEKAQAVATLLHVATHHYTLPSGAIVDDSRHSRHFKTSRHAGIFLDFQAVKRRLWQRCLRAPGWFCCCCCGKPLSRLSSSCNWSCVKHCETNYRRGAGYLTHILSRNAMWFPCLCYPIPPVQYSSSCFVLSRLTSKRSIPIIMFTVHFLPKTARQISQFCHSGLPWSLCLMAKWRACVAGFYESMTVYENLFNLFRDV